MRGHRLLSQVDLRFMQLVVLRRLKKSREMQQYADIYLL